MKEAIIRNTSDQNRKSVEIILKHGKAVVAVLTEFGWTQQFTVDEVLSSMPAEDLLGALEEASKSNSSVK